MDPRDDSSRFGSFPTTTSRNMSSSSSAFFSAVQSPFFTPRPSTCQRSESTLSDAQCDSLSLDPLSANGSVVRDPEPQQDLDAELLNISFRSCERVSSAQGVSNSPSRFDCHNDNEYSKFRGKQRKRGCGFEIPFTEDSVPLSTNRLRCCDVFIGLHGRKPSLLRFVNWLRAELELQGMSCFTTDRSRCRNSRKHGIVERAMDVSSFGVVILTRKSFKNPYTIEELRFFANKKNLIPIFFDLSPGDCLMRDIVERRGEIWEKHGGELWVLYGGLEKEWKEAVHGLSRVDEWKLGALDGNWRDCIFQTVTLLAMKLGRRSIAERLSKWREKAEGDEFPFPRNEAFVGRKKELSELEFMLFGDISGESERDYFELKATKPRKKNVTLSWSKSTSREERRTLNKKGKEKVLWKESEKEIEMQNAELPQPQQPKRSKNKGGHNAKRRKKMKIVYGKGIACVSGEPGIGKTELLLEFAYRHYQRYKMVLWINGESRYVLQNYLNLWSYLEVDIGVENSVDKSRIKSFEEQEEAALYRVRRELMRNIPFLVVINNLESEKDWWNNKPIMDLLPRFGSETHILISTRLPRVMNLEPLRLSYLSGAEAMVLMQGNVKDYSITELDVLRVIEEKMGRLTLGLAIVGSILSELPISPSRLLDTINRTPLRDFSWTSSRREGSLSNLLGQNTFLLQLFEVCFSIFDHADGPRSLATRMVQASGYFAPAPIPVMLLATAANRLPDKRRGPRLLRKILRSLSCGLTSSYARRSEAEAASMLLRFNLARSSTKPDCIYVNDLLKLYSRQRLVEGAAQAMIHAVTSRGSVTHHPDHIWATCFLLFGFGNKSALVRTKPSDLLTLVKGFILPLAVRTFITFSRCSASLELLRVCTDALEAADQALVAPIDNWLDGTSLCWQSVKTDGQLNPGLWHDLALSRATVLETRAKLMLRGGQFGLADDLVRKAIFIRTSINGENHPATVSARETLSKLTRLLSNAQLHNPSP